MEAAVRDDARRLLARALPSDELLAVAPLEGGISNVCYRAKLSRCGDVVVRIFLRDALASRKETELLKRLQDVPTPEMLFAGDDERTGPFIVYRFVPGMTLRELRRGGDRAAVAQAAFATGVALARIARHAPVEGTPLRADASVATTGSLSDRLRACAGQAVFVRSVGTATAERFVTLVERQRSALADLFAQTELVHGDFSRSNVIVRHGARWEVAAIIDWEFACGGSTLFDIGHFLRYERPGDPWLEPHFHEGFVAGGGALPQDWRALARLADLACMAAALTKNALPQHARIELVALLEESLRVLDQNGYGAEV